MNALLELSRSIHDERERGKDASVYSSRFAAFAKSHGGSGSPTTPRKSSVAQYAQKPPLNAPDKKAIIDMGAMIQTPSSGKNEPIAQRKRGRRSKK